MARPSATRALGPGGRSAHKRTMITSQLITLAVLAVVVAALIWDRVRSDVVALAGAAVLLMTGVVRPVEVQGAFASPAIIALRLAVRDRLRDGAVGLARRVDPPGHGIVPAHWPDPVWVGPDRAGRGGVRLLDNTPIVVLGAPVVRDVAKDPGPVAQTLPDPAVLRCGAWRLLHSDRHLDQPAGQRHSARWPASRASAFSRSHRSALSLRLQASAYLLLVGAGSPRAASRKAQRPRRAKARSASPGSRADRSVRRCPLPSTPRCGRWRHCAGLGIRRRGRAGGTSRWRRSPPARSPGRCC